MKKIKAAILGASGYTGSELLRILYNHPLAEINHLTADRHAGEKIHEVFPHFLNLLNIELKPLDPNSIPEDTDVVFLALPHGKSSNVIKEIIKRNIKIIDLGADFRLSPDSYNKWYGEHSCPDLIKESVYGITELYREEIKKAKLIANPGCYPTSAIIPIAPLIKINLINEHIIIDSKSGVSGAGRSIDLAYHFCEVNEGVKAYNVGEHRHAPEIEECLSVLSQKEVKVSFTPHLIPIDRGIISTIYVKPTEIISTEEIIEILENFYGSDKFIRILPKNQFPSTSNVKGSNFCDVGVKSLPENNLIILVSVIDNLVKGASGQAIQNMNLMFQMDEDLGLNFPPSTP